MNPIISLWKFKGEYYESLRIELEYDGIVTWNVREGPDWE